MPIKMADRRLERRRHGAEKDDPEFVVKAESEAMTSGSPGHQLRLEEQAAIGRGQLTPDELQAKARRESAETSRD